MPTSLVLESGNILFDLNMFCTTDAQGLYSDVIFYIPIENRSLLLKGNLRFLP